MKQTNFLKSFFLLCALIVGSLNVWAAGTSGTINFGNGSGDLNVNSSPVSGNDSQSNTWTVTTAGTTSYTPNADYAQIGSSKKPATSITFTMTLAANQNITAFSAKFGGFGDTAGTVTLKVDNTTVGTGSLNGTADVTVTNSSSTTGKTLTVTVTGISKGVKAYFISYTYEAAKTLDHITLSGTYPTSFTEQDEFSHEGMTVTANYEDSSSKDVTSSATFTGYDMDEIGNQTVTVSYTEGNKTKTATYDITINAGEKYTVSFDPEAGTCGTASLKESAYKGGVTLPAATIGLDGWVFAGWAADATASTTTRPTLYKSSSTYYPTANTTLYAVYTLDGVDYEKYERATTLDQITSASQIAIVNASKILNNEFANTTAPTETEGKIDEPSSGRIWTLSGDNTEGFTLTNGGETLGTTTETFSSSTSYVVSLSSNNNKWLFVESTSGTNNFVVRNTNLNSNSLVGSLQFYTNGSKWQAYFLASSTFAGNPNVASKIYVPVSTVFNSNPTQAVVTPVVAFNSKDAKTLYLDGTITYTNTAKVTGIDKPISYSSSDESVATVNASGVVTAVGIGTATITASVAAELGVNKAASDTYELTVKNTTTIAGLKALYNAAQSPAKAFAADLTDAVVTYVSGTHAYIQDASGAIYASCGSSLTAGKKINGAVSGTITAPNTIDEIKTIDLSAATVTEDGVIPVAAVKTLAEIKAGDYDGKLVTVNGATVKTGMNDATSGGVITDDDNVTTFNIIAPNKLTLNATEEGNFTAFVSIYGGSTYRLNIYEASQFVKTRNVATAQPLAFTEDAIELDEETTAFAEFTGQAVEGAQGTVTYAITGDAIGTVNASTGAVTLNGTYGTATITATAAAKEVTEAGVTTPYTETAKSYTITVNPRYSVTFSVNGIETVLRQATSGATIAVPTPGDLGDYKFMGWSTSTVAPTDDEPSMTALGATVTPDDNDDKYFAVYAQERAGGEEEITSTLNLKQSEPSQPQVINDVTWSWSNVTFTTGNAGMKDGDNATVTFTLPVSALNAKKIKLNCPNMTWGGDAVVVLKAGSTELASMKKDGSYTFTSSDNKEGTYTMSQTAYANAWINSFTLTYAVVGIENFDYRTSLPTVEVTISDSKYLSFCYGSKLDFSESDVKAYKASVDGEGKVTLTKVDVVPAGEGVVLYCETPDTYSIPVTTKDASDVTGNEMVGVLVRTQVVWNPTTGIYNYILQQGQFNKATDGYLKPNRAYLSTSYDVTPSGAKALSVVFAEDETDGIRSIENSRIENSDYYNLAGQKVGADYKGIVIVNGKKYMRK